MMDNQVKVEAKRIVDGECTTKVLALLRDTGLATAESICTALLPAPVGTVLGNHDKFYLKGGNSFALLENKATTGDWDFQLSPELAGNVYANWELNTGATELDTLKTDIVRELWATAVATLGDTVPGITGKGTNIQADFGTLAFREALNKKLAKIKVEVTHVEVTDKSLANRSYEVGEDYRILTERGIQTSVDYKKEDGDDGMWRIDLPDPTPVQLPGPVGAPAFHPWLEPCVYLNSAIPGFLLFRLALLYKLTVKHDGGAPEPLVMKSELIDISIPRKGAPEALLPTTYVTELVPWTEPTATRLTNIKIPGWRYHMFENIMLLTEIKLKISGSPHKEEKRKKRAADALKHLKRLNSADDSGSADKFNRMLNKATLKEHATIAASLPSYAVTYVNELTHTSAEVDKGGALSYKRNLETKLKDINHLLTKEKRFKEFSAFLATFHANEDAFPKMDALLSIIAALLDNKCHGETTTIIMNYLCSAYVWIKMAKLGGEDEGKADELRFSQNSARFAVDPTSYERVKKNYLDINMKGSIDTLAIRKIDFGEDSAPRLVRQNSFVSAPGAMGASPERMVVRLRNDFARNKEALFAHVSLMKRDVLLTEGAKEELLEKNVKKFLPAEFKVRKKVHIMTHANCVEHLEELLANVSILGIRYHISRIYNLLLKSRNTQP